MKQSSELANNTCTFKITLNNKSWSPSMRFLELVLFKKNYVVGQQEVLRDELSQHTPKREGLKEKGVQ